MSMTRKQNLNGISDIFIVLELVPDSFVRHQWKNYFLVNSNKHQK